MKKSNFKGFIITSVAYFVLMIIFIPTYTQAQSSYIDEISVNVIQIETESSLGSGLIIPVDDTLYIFTNRHVVEGYYNFKINVLEDVNETVVHKFNADLIAYS